MTESIPLEVLKIKTDGYGNEIAHIRIHKDNAGKIRTGKGAMTQ